MPDVPPLSILYEDQWLVAIDKPAGQMVHPASQPQDGDQVTMKILRDQIGQHVYTIHRLDRPTTGVLLFGKDPAASKLLHKALARHEFTKTYYAVIHGQPAADHWECNQPLQKQAGAPDKEAHTSFKTLATIKSAALCNQQEKHLTLLEAVPHTGRYHQIRRHLLHAELPIVGDYRYAGIEKSNLMGALLNTGSRMLLQAKKLELLHPVTMEQLTIEASLDQNIQKRRQLGTPRNPPSCHRLFGLRVSLTRSFAGVPNEI